jgi:hypothetical protein
MSELLASAAEKMGVPEALVKRSAEARAKAAGSDTDDVLNAWAGGESAPAAAAPPPTQPEPDTAEDTGDTPPADTAPEPPAEPAAQPAAQRVAAVAGAPRSTVPPVLVGRNDRLAGAMLGTLALLALSLLVGFAVASTPEDSSGAYTSQFAYSQFALDGRDVYRSEGCAACHTQVVRPIVADAGLGGVSMSDSNQVIGIRRIGPDLAHIGSRVQTDADLYMLLDGGSGHPSYRGLGQVELDALVAYLMESK